MLYLSSSFVSFYLQAYCKLKAKVCSWLVLRIHREEAIILFNYWRIITGLQFYVINAKHAVHVLRFKFLFIFFSVCNKKSWPLLIEFAIVIICTSSNWKRQIFYNSQHACTIHKFLQIKKNCTLLYGTSCFQKTCQSFIMWWNSERAE